MPDQTDTNEKKQESHSPPNKKIIKPHTLESIPSGAQVVTSGDKSSDSTSGVKLPNLSTSKSSGTTTAVNKRMGTSSSGGEFTTSKSLSDHHHQHTHKATSLMEGISKKIKRFSTHAQQIKGDLLHSRASHHSGPHHGSSYHNPHHKHRQSLLTPEVLADLNHCFMATNEGVRVRAAPNKSEIETRRGTMAKITFSLSQQTHVLRLEKFLDEGADVTGKAKCFRKRQTSMHEFKKVNEDGEEMLGIPMDREVKDFQRDYFRRMEEAAIKRKSLRIRKRWLKVYRKAQTVLKIGKSLAKRSKAFELKPQTYVDIGDSVTISVDYGAGRSIDTSEYRRKKEISISAQVTETLTSNPPDRTLLQLEEARRELQKVQVFSEYPLNVQEQILRRAFYITVGPQRVILRQGHIARNFFVIICGEAYVKEHVWDEEREEMVARAAAFIKTGDTFGSHALIHGENRGSSVISRTNMQLLAINGDDYLDLIFRRALSDELPAHIQYLSEMNFMENFPISLLTEKLTVCSMHHFRRNTVITDDSRKCGNLFIIKYGYCKVFRKLHSRERAESEQEVPSFRIINEDTSSDLFQSLLQYQSYIERDSPYVSYVEMPSPAGHTTRLPVTTVPGRKDRIHNQPLRLPDEQRQFVPLMLLREGEVFGLDQTPMCPSRAKSRPTILVSLGAEVIALNKDFYCRHAAKEAKEVAEKTFIYDDVFIRRRLRERVNRDVHLEEVLKHYFLKMAQVKAEIKEQALQEDFL